jgi:hypothetical protein
VRKYYQLAAVPAAALLLPVFAPGTPAPASVSEMPTACRQPAEACGFPVFAGRTYTIGTSYQANSTVRAVAYTYSAAAGWRKWFTGSPYGQSATWAPLETRTPAVPVGTERIGVDFPTASLVRDVSLTASPSVRRPLTYRPALGKKSGLVTNSYGSRNPKRKDAAYSPVWQVTAGSLFASAGAGDTGRIDDGIPGPRSSPHTGSAVFRMNTRRNDFLDVKVSFAVNITGQTTTSYTPASSYDGVHIWLRHKSQYELYAASVTRRDGVVLIKKKCQGGPTNGGTYYTLGAQVPGMPVKRNTWQQMAATVQNNPSGSVTIVVYVRGQAVISAVDTGIGCKPIRAAAPVGIRGDNTRFRFDKFTVTNL